MPLQDEGGMAIIWQHGALAQQPNSIREVSQPNGAKVVSYGFAMNTVCQQKVWPRWVDLLLLYY